jgi:hypothetical protein
MAWNLEDFMDPTVSNIRRHRISTLGDISTGARPIWEVPEYARALEDFRTKADRDRGGLLAGLKAADVKGPAAGLALERQAGNISGGVMDLTNRMRGEATRQQDEIIGRGEADAADKRRLMMEAYLARKARKSQEAIAKKQQQTGATGQICCFIFIEGNRMTDNVRTLRDTFFPRGGTVENGYRKMARWLVPIMARNWFVKKNVQIVMLNPICSIADNYYKQNSYGWMFKPIGCFWAKIWRRLGDDTTKFAW